MRAPLGQAVLMASLTIVCVADWTLYSNVNCYGGHGADDLEGTIGQPCGIMSLDECKEKCEQMPSCQGITVETSSGKCYRRGSISISSCDRGGPTADGYDTWVGPETKPSWGFATSSNISTSPVTGRDGTVYVGSLDSTLYAIHANGTLRWKIKVFAGGRIFAPPVIGKDGTVYVISCNVGNSTNACVNATTYPSVQGLGTSLYAVDGSGNAKWQFNCGAGMMIQQPPLLHGNDAIYILTGNGGFWNYGDKGALHMVHSSDGIHMFDSVEFDGSPGQWSPEVANDGAIYITTFIGCTPKCVPSCSLVRVTNGTKDVLKQGAVNFDNGENCLGPKIGSDGTVYALLGDLMMWNASGHLAWTFSTNNQQHRFRPIKSFALGANDIAFVQTGYAWGESVDNLAVYGVTTTGELKWARNISDGATWSSLMVSPNGTFQVVEFQVSPAGQDPNGASRTSLVTLDPFVGNTVSSITVQGYLSNEDQIWNLIMGQDGTVALSACVSLSPGYGPGVWGHEVLYVVPENPKHGWSFTLGECDEGKSNYFSAVAADGSVYFTEGALLYKLVKLAKQASVNSGFPIFV